MDVNLWGLSLQCIACIMCKNLAISKLFDGDYKNAIDFNPSAEQWNLEIFLFKEY